jgi:hypothetical protein
MWGMNFYPKHSCVSASFFDGYSNMGFCSKTHACKSCLVVSYYLDHKGRGMLKKGRERGSAFFRTEKNRAGFGSETQVAKNTIIARMWAFWF